MVKNPAKRIPLRTLAIDPGTREMGYAVLEGTELISFGVHTFTHRKSARDLLREGQRFISELMETFAPDIFAIEKTFYVKTKRSSLLHVFVDEMKRFAKRRRLMVMAYAPSAVKKAITGNGAATKREVAEFLINHGYSYLAKYLHTDLRTKETYWMNMFDAVAVGLTGYEEVVKRNMLKALKKKTRT